MEPICFETHPRRSFINCADFEGDDLSIFIDSMETISRIECERHERRQRRRIHKLNTSKLTISAEVHTTPRSISISSSTTEDEEEYPIEPKAIYPKQLRGTTFTADSNDDISPGQSSDENYFSGASRSESPSNGSKESIVPLSTDSGTESESGVFQLRPRSFAMTNPKYRTTRARIIGLVLKREYTDGGSQDELEKQERRDRLLEGLLREKEKCESMRLPRKECLRKPILNKTNRPSAEMRFIDKALRYLTL